MGRLSKSKGARIERELVQLHKQIGVVAQKTPLSGAVQFRGTTSDLDIYPDGFDHAPLIAECKARASGAGFATLERWLADFDLLFLRKDRCDPLVAMPWRVYERLIKRGRG
jgi:Holliday junction resolvase